jgi:hypothetical protein
MATYHERVRWPGWFLLALGIVLVGSYAALGASGAAPTWAFLLAFGPFLLVSYALWRLRFLEIEIGPLGLGFGFGGVRRRVPRERIVAVEVKAYPVTRYMGWGYRLGWEQRERAYSVLGCARGVLVTFDDERGRRWKVFLSSREPETAAAAMAQ